MITGKVKGRSINAVIFPSMSDDFRRFLPLMRENCYICAEVIQIHVIMIDTQLYEYMMEMLRKTPTGFHRYLYQDIPGRRNLSGSPGREESESPR